MDAVISTADEQTAARWHRASLASMMRQAEGTDRHKRRAAALLWLLQITDSPPSTTDAGTDHRELLETYRANLQRSTFLPNISTSRQRLLNTKDRVRAIAWALERADEASDHWLEDQE